MIIEIVLELIMISCGLYCIIKGKIPFINNYHGIKKIELHSRIEGSALLLVGLIMILQSYIPMRNIGLIVITLIIAVFTLILEILFKAI